MAGETTNIQQIAEKISRELFCEYFWTQTGPMNYQWPCEDRENHQSKSGSHPADVVFWYDEPYSNVRTYVHCDLKSYAVGTISSSAIRTAIESLAKQVACANISDTWQRLYRVQDITPDICGLLFVYNHDGNYDRSFNNILEGIKPGDLNIPKSSKIVVIGPQEINWLDNVRYEIRQMRGAPAVENRLPSQEHYTFFYPQLVRKANLRPTDAKAARLEMLTSSMIVLKYFKPDCKKTGVVVFYKREGKTVQEFKHLIDYLRIYQLLESQAEICIKTLYADGESSTVFQQAVNEYIYEMAHNHTLNDGLAALVKNIKYERMTAVLSRFSDIDLGMNYD